MDVAAAIRLLRPKQWTKNLLVFAALVFTAGFRDPEQVRLAFLTFVAMCFASSSMYAANDIFDRERDRSHPLKKNRPVASGRISVSVAGAIAVVCLAASLAIAWFVGAGVAYGVIAYLAIQALYNLLFKTIPVLDVFTVSLGFVLRAAIGAIAVHAQISMWLLFCTGALALLLGFGKRRSEFISMGAERVESRPALQSYTKPALDALVLLSACCSGIAFGMYVIESDTAQKYPALFITAPVVLFGIYRYVYLVFARDEGGEPENLVFADPQMIGTLLVFLACAFFAMSKPELPFILQGN